MQALCKLALIFIWKRLFFWLTSSWSRSFSNLFTTWFLSSGYMPVLVKPLLRFLLVRLSINLFKRLGNLEHKNFRRKVRWKIISSQNFEFYIVHKVVTAHHWQSCRTWESGMLYDYSSPVQGTCFPSSSGIYIYFLIGT